MNPTHTNTPTVTVKEPDAARYLAVSQAFLRKARRVNLGPSFIRVGRTVMYRIADLDRWQNAHRIDPTGRESDRSRRARAVLNTPIADDRKEVVVRD